MLSSKTIILTPHYREIHPKTERALKECERAGFHVWRLPGHSAIDQIRIHMANAMLEKGYENLFWIDADMGFDLSAVRSLIESGHPIVSAVCPMKDGSNRGCIVHHPNTNLRETETIVEFCGTGFLFTAAKVYRDIAQSLKPCLTRWGMQVPFFMPFVENDAYRSEDFAFCSRAKACGYSIMVNTKIRVGHFGDFEFKWDGHN